MIKKTYFAFIILFLYSSNILSQVSNISITSPNSKEILLGGEEYLLTWSALNVSEIKIEFSENNGNDWVEIASLPAIPNHFYWKTPSINTSEALIRISDFKANQSIVNFIISDIPRRELLSNQILEKTSDIQSEPIKIMLLGNSITRGSAGSPDRVGYRRSLYLSLIGNEYNIDFVGTKQLGLLTDFDLDHEGNSGWHAGYPANPGISIRDNVMQWLELLNPDIVLLHAGTNDIIGLENSGEDITVTVSEVKSIIDSIKVFGAANNKDIIVLLAQIINMEDNLSTISVNEFDTVSALNLLLEEMADSLIFDGEKIMIVNHENKLIYPDDLNDGIHPNQSGYDKMADTWLDALLPVLGFQPTITLQPITKGIFEGDSVAFSVEASGSSFLNFQWSKNGDEIIGETDSVIKISSVSEEDNNAFFSCTVSNLLGAVASDTAFLFVSKLNERVTGGQIAYYDFEENDGNTIFDLSNYGEQLNLLINDLDSVSWIPHGLNIYSPTIISSTVSANKIVAAVQYTNEISLETWLAPKYLDQSDPARIITLSENSLARNFTFSQYASSLNVSIRTSETDNNGLPSFDAFENSLNYDLFHLVYTRNNAGFSKFYVNGIIIDSINISGDFSNWNSDYFLGIANEFIDSRPWLGALYGVALYNRELSDREINHNYVYGIPGITELSEPEDLIISEADSNKIVIDWTDNLNENVMYLIERAKDEKEDFFVIDSTVVDIKSYTDTNIVDGTIYYYRIRAYNEYVISNYSNLDSISFSLRAPTNLVGFTNSLDLIELTWKDNSANEHGYIIEGRPLHPDSTFFFIDSVSTNVTFYEDINPKFFTPFEYRIYAYNKKLISVFSNTIQINVVGISNNNSALPKEFSLAQNYPNPFNPTTIFKFSIPVRSSVNLKLYNILGQIVDILYNNTVDAGVYELVFNSSNLTSGVYFYSIEAVSENKKFNFKDVKKMIVQK